jgi:hypothetical protein
VCERERKFGRTYKENTKQKVDQRKKRKKYKETKYERNRKWRMKNRNRYTEEINE